MYEVPIFAIDVPMQQNEDNVQYVADQLRKLKEFIEECTGKKITDEALTERLRRSKRTLEKFAPVSYTHLDVYKRQDMERIGDQASDIAEIIITEEKSEAQDIPKIIKMSEAAGKMVRDSVNAYVEKDLELSRKVIKDDDIVDELCLLYTSICGTVSDHPI